MSMADLMGTYRKREPEEVAKIVKEQLSHFRNALRDLNIHPSDEQLTKIAYYLWMSNLFVSDFPSPVPGVLD